MSNVKKYTKIPLTIEAIQYTNSQDLSRISEIIEFTGHKFQVRDIKDVGDSVITAEVYDELHDTWVGVKDGDYIIRGIDGEFYPHDEALFPQAYIESWQQEAAEVKQNANPTPASLQNT